jgi:hypothetical protein
MPLSTGIFHKNWCCESCTLHKGINENLLVFHIFCSIWIKFITGDVHKYVLRNGDFLERWYSESHTLVRGMYNFVPVLAMFIVQFG